MMKDSTNKGILFDGMDYYLRLEDKIEKYTYDTLPDFGKEVVDAILKTHSYLV